MKKKTSKQIFTQKIYDEVSRGLQSFQPVTRNNWVIKFSVYGGKILVFFHSKLSGQTIVRFFADEKEACAYIHYVITQNPSIEIST